MTEGIKRCTAREAREALNLGSGCQLVDVREHSEYAAERVAGARLAPLSSLEAELRELDPARTVYLMCRSGKRAAQAAGRLAARGFKDLRVIEGGLQGWMAAGFEVERGSGRVWSLERQVRFAAGLLVLVGVVLSLVSPWLILLSGFVGAGLTFSAVTDTCGMAMLLARMPWNRKPKALTDAACESS